MDTKIMQDVMQTEEVSDARAPGLNGMLDAFAIYDRYTENIAVMQADTYARVQSLLPSFEGEGEDEAKHSALVNLLERLENDAQAHADTVKNHPHESCFYRQYARVALHGSRYYREYMIDRVDQHSPLCSIGFSMDKVTYCRADYYPRGAPTQVVITTYEEDGVTPYFVFNFC